MEEKKLVPKLRFPGFTEPWEQHKLGDYLIQYTEITTQNNQYPVLTSSRKGLFFQTDYYDGNQIASKDNTGYNIVPYGYFTYRHMSDDEIFHFNINYIVDKGIVSTLYPVFTTKNLNSNFLQLQLNYGNEFRKYAVLLKQGGSRTYMYFNKLKNLNLTISTSIGEQEIIAKFFILFEKLITLHQRKLEHLKLKKKSLLQKLFPKEGEVYPELRFPGFTDPWEQRKLGDIATITGGGTPSTNISEYWNGDIDWYSPVEIGEKRYASGSIRKITKLGLEKSSAKILPVGTVLFTSRAGIGNTAILQVEGCTNQGFQSITPNSKELDTYFLYTMTPKLKRYGEVTGAGSTFVEVSGKQMEQMNLMIPSLDEQKHVSQLFKVMDDAITLHQRKLEHLQLLKKALLQQLFV